MKKSIFFIVMSLLYFNVSAQITITFTNVVQPCNNNGSATAIVTGGTAPYTYQWVRTNLGATYLNPPTSVTVSATNSVSNAERGFYILTVTDALSQQATSTLFMPGMVHFIHDTVSTPYYSAISLGFPAICPSYSGSVGAQIAGTNPPYVFSLSSIGTQTTSALVSNFNNVPIGSYTCIVTDNIGCADTVPLGVGAYAGFYVDFHTTPDTCTSNGTATAIPIGTGGGTAPFTYLWNTNPPQNTQTISGLESFNNSGLYISVTVTDANGCVAVGSPYIQDSITVHSIQSTATIQNATCPQNDGYVVVHNTGGAPPYTYQWSTGSTIDSIYNVAPGTYYVTVTDAAGCHEKFTKVVYGISPVNMGLTVTNANCSNTGGAITTSVSGGTAPYTYQWSNGQTTDSIYNLGAGFYDVLVKDVNGCESWAGNSVYNPDSCVAKISGQVFNDMNGNCVFDPNESGLPQQVIQLNNGTIYFSDWSGKFYIPPVLNPTGTYTLSQTTLVPWIQVCPSSAILLNLVGGNTYTNNIFYDKPIPLQNDLLVYVMTDTCRPGFVFNQWVAVFNQGTSTMSGSATLQCDALLSVVNTGNSSAYNAGTNTFTFSFNNLAPMTWYMGNVQLQAPSSTPLFTPLTSYAVANPISGDVTPANNYDTLHYRVTGSYDPNAKSVSPRGIGPNGNISTADSLLTFTIHFQNTGSYATTFVTILDTLDANLDVYSLRLIGSSPGYPYNLPHVSISSANVAKFEFDYCNLPPTSVDSINSNGFITYTIKLKKNLALGTQIKNRADIYFDYNTAILTNTTINTITSLAGIKSLEGKSGNILVYPNPFSNQITIENKSQTAITKICICDLLGREIMALRHEQKETITIDTESFNKGIYFVKTYTGNNSYTVKLIKE